MCTLVPAEEQIHGSPCLPNELLLSLFHSSLEHELSDREIPLADSDHVTFMHHILERERDGHVAPFSLPVIKGQYMSLHLRTTGDDMYLLFCPVLSDTESASV